MSKHEHRIYSEYGDWYARVAETKELIGPYSSRYTCEQEADAAWHEYDVYRDLYTTPKDFNPDWDDDDA